MTLTGNRILVQSDEVTEWRGLAIPLDITRDDNPFSEARIGTVLAIGVGRRTKKGVLIPIEGISVGDRVLLPRNGKTAMQFNDAFCWLLSADDVLGKLENAA